jgi:fructose-specific component phosphotransferase system IIB-like protein
MNLLNIDANAKTVKGQKKGYMTAVLYLAPYTSSGTNLCPMAKTAGCYEGCLNTAGRGGIAKDRAVFATDAGMLPDNNIQHARIARSQLFINDRIAFMTKLAKEITAFIRKAEKKNLTPVVRLNGTSDILWETIPYADHDSIMQAFPTIQFYDYTKVYKRAIRPLPANYHLSLSYSQANQKYALATQTITRQSDVNLVVVFRDSLPETFLGRRVVNGDESDLRFLDEKNVIVGLKAKGRAKKDTSGFVIDPHQFSEVA